jgi:hypothetical protein
MNPSPSTSQNPPTTELPAPPPRDESPGVQLTTAPPSEPEPGKDHDDGQDMPAGNDSRAMEALDKDVAEAHGKQPVPALGFNPLKWRREMTSYADNYADWEIARRKAAMEKYLPRTEHERVTEAIAHSIRHLLSKTITFSVTSVSYNFFVSISTSLLVLAPPVVVYVFVQAHVDGWARVGASGLALTLNLIWILVASYATYQWIKLRSPQRAVKLKGGYLNGNPGRTFTPPVIVFLLLFASIPAIVAGLPLRIQNTPSWLSYGWFHAAFAAFAFTFGVWMIVIISGSIFIRVYWSLVWRKVSSHLPEQQLIDRITALITSVSAPNGSRDSGVTASPTAAQSVHIMEDVAKSFEQYWPRRYRTGYAQVDRAARRWARQVAAAIRAQQLPLLIGRNGSEEMSASLARLVVNVIDKDTFTEDPKDYRSYRHAVWWRRLGKPALAGVLLLTTAALIFLAAWQPGLPEMLNTWKLAGLANAMSLPDDLRPGVLAGAVAVFGLFVKLVAPSSSGKAGRGESRLFD